MRIFAHLSDLHLDGGERADARAAAVLGYLREIPLTAVVVTGDLADHGLPAEYRRAAELLQHTAPVVACPGNHDARGPFREVLLGARRGRAGEHSGRGRPRTDRRLRLDHPRSRRRIPCRRNAELA